MRNLIAAAAGLMLTLAVAGAAQAATIAEVMGRWRLEGQGGWIELTLEPGRASYAAVMNGRPQNSHQSMRYTQMPDGRVAMTEIRSNGSSGETAFATLRGNVLTVTRPGIQTMVFQRANTAADRPAPK